MGAAGRALVGLALVCMTACGTTVESVKSGGAYVPWLPLPPAHQHAGTPQSSPVSPPPVPAGTPRCGGSQLEGVPVGMGAALSNVNMPLLFRNRGESDCFVEGYPFVSVYDRSGRLLASSADARSQGTYFSDDPISKVMLLHGTPPLPKTYARTNGSLGQAFMNFSWYDCRNLQASRLAIDLPDAGGRFWMPFPTKSDVSPACYPAGRQYTATQRGPFSAAGVSWAPSLDDTSAAVDLVAPGSVARGTTLEYFVTIRNDSSRDYDMQPCADYYESLVKTELASHQLNCEPVGQIAPGRSVTFEMPVDIPKNFGAGASELWWCLDDARTSMVCVNRAITIT